MTNSDLSGHGEMMKKGISSAEALDLIRLMDHDQLLELFIRAAKERKKYFGNKATTCSIVNARCGGCPEDCAFCAQSKRSKADVEYYPLISEEELFKAAKSAQKEKADFFSIVTSGRAVNISKELEVICRAIRRISSDLKMKTCASLGILNEESLKMLKDAGLSRYHHNLETAGSYFPEICGTRSYEDQLQTIAVAKKIGLSVCCGGIFGLGESLEQRIELLETIRGLEVDSVPLNFLHPIPGTPLEKQHDLNPFECLKIIAIARLMMPDLHIRICGGRDVNLRDFQSWIFHVGADALMIGGYLVTSGRDVEADLQMIADAGMILPGERLP
jgi:biotin synthase